MIDALKLVLIGFEDLSGLKVNFTKSELVPLNYLSQQESTLYANIMGCKISSFPIQYFGFPLQWKKLNNKD
jgi:hypothetical protein